MFQDKNRRPRLLNHIRRVLCSKAVLVVLVALCSLVADCVGKDAEKHIASEQNSKLSELVKRLHLVQAAGSAPHTGQYFVKLYEVPQGEECDAGGNLCEGMELLISVASPDLYGDNGLYRVKGLISWKFVEWKKYSEGDSPDDFTSFVVNITTKENVPLTECRNARPGGGQNVTFIVNPWKISCEYGS